MRRVVLSMFVTLDGFISGPNGELDWMPGTEGRFDDEVDSYLYDMLDEMDTMLLGARTYEPLFRRMKDRVALKHADTRTFKSGTALLSYLPQLDMVNT